MDNATVDEALMDMACVPDGRLLADRKYGKRGTGPPEEDRPAKFAAAPLSQGLILSASIEAGAHDR